jgi:hypothetical protein
MTSVLISQIQIIFEALIPTVYHILHPTKMEETSLINKKGFFGNRLSPAVIWKILRQLKQ